MVNIFVMIMNACEFTINIIYSNKMGIYGSIGGRRSINVN